MSGACVTCDHRDTGRDMYSYRPAHPLQPPPSHPIPRKRRYERQGWRQRKYSPFPEGVTTAPVSSPLHPTRSPIYLRNPAVVPAWSQRGGWQGQFDHLQEAHEQLRSESSTEIRKLRREAREVAKLSAEKHAGAVAEAAAQASALRDEIEEGEERLHAAETRHREEVEKLKRELSKVGGRGCDSEHPSTINIVQDTGCAVNPPLNAFRAIGIRKDGREAWGRVSVTSRFDARIIFL